MSRYDTITETNNIDRIQHVVKYNPNHDPATGRFTSGSGGPGITRGSESSSQGTNTSSQQKNPSQGNSGGGSSTFKPAKDSIEAAKYAKEVLGFTSVDYSYRTPDYQWESLDIDTINHINETITSIQEKYPELKGKVKNLGAITGGPESRMAQYRVSGRDMDDTYLEVGTVFTKGKSELKQTYDKDVQLGYHPKGTDYTSILWHEYGHVYADTIRQKQNTGLELQVDRRNCSTEDKWLSAAAKSKGVDPQIYSNRISGYAGKDAGEAFAEAFAEYNCSRTPRPECIELMKQAGISNKTEMTPEQLALYFG